MLGLMAFRLEDQIREGGKWKEAERERERLNSKNGRRKQ